MSTAGAGRSAPTLARTAYSLLWRLLLPLVWLRVRWRGRREPLYAEHLSERFGVYRGAVPRGALWVHSVSLGETRAAAPLLAALRGLRPGLRLLLTHGTATGRAAGRDLLLPGDAQLWLPFDTPGAVRRFLRHAAPIGGVLMETEIWPNLLAGAAAHGVPVVLANARLSERSRRRGARVDALLRPAFESLALALAQTGDDAARLRDAGVGRTVVLGNLKYDIAPDERLLTRGRAWRERLGAEVVLAASFRDGEEAQLLEVWRDLPSPRPRLVVVPRHPQRFDAVAALIESAGFSLSRRSAWVEDAPPADARAADVVLGDSMLEMPAWYTLADVALLGGSFAPFGGQNLIEAAACGCPVVMGPHTFNFAQAAEWAEAAGAAERAADLPAAVTAAVALLGDPDKRASRVEAARRFAAAHTGSATASAAHIVALLPTDTAQP